MADNNEVVVKLLLANNQFLSQIAKSQKKTTEFSTAAKKSAETAKAGFGSLKAAVGAIGFGLLVMEIKEFAKEAGKFNTIKAAFENLAASHGKNSSLIIESMQAASKGTMSMQDTMESASNAIQLMGEDVIEMLPKMTEIATAAARASGVEVSTMMNDLVKASGRQSVMILDNLGISSVTAGKKMEEYAAKLGKTREQMNASEKAAAFFYAVTEAGGEIVKRAGDKTLTLGEQVQVLNARTKDLGAKLKNDATPGLKVLTSALSDAAKEGGFLQVAMDKIGSAMNSMFAHLAWWMRQIDWHLGGQRDQYEKNLKIYEQNVAYAKQHLELARKLQKEGKESEAAMHMKEYKAALESGKKVMSAAQKIYSDYSDSLGDIAKALDDATKKQEKFNGVALKKDNKDDGGGESGKKSGSGFLGGAVAIAMGWSKTKEEIANSSKSIVSDVQGLAQTWGDNISSLFERISDNMISALDRRKTQISGLFDFMEQRALQSAGVMELTQRQQSEKEISTLQKQYSKTANISKKKDLQTQIREKQNEKKKYEIQEQFAQRKQALDLLMELYEIQIKRRQFERNKQYQLAMVWINTAAAITAAWLTAWSMGFPPLAIAMGAVSTALLLANAIAQTAVISTQQAPAFATGSWDVQHTGPAILHGGEIVTPKPIADSIRSGDAYLGSGSGGGGDIVMVMDSRQVGRVVRERNSRFARSIGARSYSMAGAY
ncbi:MAG: hypothetical protein WC455_20495 [Dehalococcoidia bacterium]|jgi:hypothetical protein